MPRRFRPSISTFSAVVNISFEVWRSLLVIIFTSMVSNFSSSRFITLVRRCPKAISLRETSSASLWKTAGARCGGEVHVREKIGVQSIWKWLEFWPCMLIGDRIQLWVKLHLSIEDLDDRSHGISTRGGCDGRSSTELGKCNPSCDVSWCKLISGLQFAGMVELFLWRTAYLFLQPLPRQPHPYVRYIESAVPFFGLLVEHQYLVPYFHLRRRGPWYSEFEGLCYPV